MSFLTSSPSCSMLILCTESRSCDLSSSIRLTSTKFAIRSLIIVPLMLFHRFLIALSDRPRYQIRSDKHNKNKPLTHRREAYLASAPHTCSIYCPASSAAFEWCYPLLWSRVSAWCPGSGGSGISRDTACQSCSRASVRCWAYVVQGHERQ